ncbi:hypothetical protein Pmani_035996 [Petrolisthes manimaculis]|uniref:Cuticle protein n=1 Tax=Petrolisthes manimaculis TaxID=1843537 RepID=A0AAE1NKG1_9EUCA|nr:hypothetical protein Pmani_035996 [Petrolisthes manimaculis]
MKFAVGVVAVVFVAMVALVVARPEDDLVFKYEGDDHTHEQYGEPGNSVQGSYTWTAPDGTVYKVKYIADEKGYRVLESNAIPETHDGVKADGQQGSFSDYDEGTEH